MNDNPAAPRRASVDALLAFAWNAGVFVSADAMAATGLTRSTAIDALDELIEIGLLRELPNARSVGEYSKGRPSRRFELRSDAAVVIGMDAGRSHLTTSVADLRGDVLVRLTTELDLENETADARREAVQGAADAALAAAGVARTSVLAACVGVPAPVDARGVSPEHRDDFWWRMNPDLRAMLGEWIPIVRIENDAALAAVAEGAVGAAVDCSDYIVVLAGDRLGAGVVSDGRLLRGAHGGAGEAIAFDSVEGVRSAYGIGSQITTWVRDDVSSGVLPVGHPLRDVPIDGLTGRDAIELARTGDPWALTIVQRAGLMTARIIAVYSSFFDPARFIISGAVADGLDEVLHVARVHLAKELHLPVPELALSTLGANSVAIGAVSAAIEAAQAGVLHLAGGARQPLNRAG
ncbi:putative NBD/HSP70 family sugar kinase [Salinibacterium sp. CAN_S4]|uniref:ROK family protein n=1 Tax=Salinibacterium sp. CAN_S4 TaxID=2787727 RepID=UPI001A29443A